MSGKTDHASGVELSWEQETKKGEPEGRFRIYRLCACSYCGGKGKADDERCPECRGEGRVRELVAHAMSPEAMGLAMVTLAREGEFEECPIGVLDTEGEVGKKWLIRPWMPSARNVSDAGRILAKSRNAGVQA